MKSTYPVSNDDAIQCITFSDEGKWPFMLFTFVDAAQGNRFALKVNRFMKLGKIAENACFSFIALTVLEENRDVPSLRIVGNLVETLQWLNVSGLLSDSVYKALNDEEEVEITSVIKKSSTITDVDIKALKQEQKTEQAVLEAMHVIQETLATMETSNIIECLSGLSKYLSHKGIQLHCDVIEDAPVVTSIKPPKK